MLYPVGKPCCTVFGRLSESISQRRADPWPAQCSRRCVKVPHMNDLTGNPASIDYAELGEQLAQREKDWRKGAVYYQVFVDRFAPSTNLDAKRDLYAPPKRLREWHEQPASGDFLAQQGVWSHEIDFWGGDLCSLRSRLAYVQGLGADVIYLNPIHAAYTNHKYDADDFTVVSPEYGSRGDLRALADALHARGMRLVLDGVFNHMGRSSPRFQAALTGSPGNHREWFYCGADYDLGYRAWHNVPNLPELRLEHPAVQQHIFAATDSVVRDYLRDGVDGWRLDVAFELGFELLSRITEAAHQVKPEALTVGEIWNYPEQWTRALDGVINFHARRLIYAFVEGSVSGAQVGRHLARMVGDIGLSASLMSWLVLDNHDTRRLRTELPSQWQQRMAQVLQFTLPGSPCVYYGAELGLRGGDDPEQRGPFRWELAQAGNGYFDWFNRLSTLRREARALRVGNFRALDTESLLAFQRFTELAAETCIVVANPRQLESTELVSIRDGRIMNRTVFKDALSEAEYKTDAGTLLLSVPARTIQVLRPQIPNDGDYSPYKRMS